MKFQVGQMVIRDQNIEDSYKNRWEEICARRKIAPYVPIAITDTSFKGDSITFQGVYGWYRAEFFKPVFLDKHLEDYL